MADRKSHRQMTRAEQIRRSESRYGGEAAHASSATRQEGRTAGARHAEARHAASRSEGVQAYTKRAKKGRRKRIVMGVVLGLLGVVLVAGVGFALWATNYINTTNSQFRENVSPEMEQMLKEPVKAQDPFYMLLLGVDKSEDRSEAWGSSDSNYRSDTIILARIDAPAQKVTLVSIPRDTLVDMGENGERKINDAYALGGGAYMLEVVEDFADVEISAYAEVDFEQFTSIVDAIGGVEVTLPIAVSDVLANVDLPAGTQIIDGAQALGLCRARHAYDEYGGGDFYRAANQRMVIGAIVKKVLTLDPVSMVSAVSSLAESVTVYPLTVTDIVSLAMQFQNFDVDTSFYSGQTPTISEYINNIWYELPDEDAWDEMMRRVEAGLPPYSDESQDFTHGVAGSIGVTSGDGTNQGTSESEVATPEETVSYSGGVLVLNGTSVNGLAGRTATKLETEGFSPYAESADSMDHTTTMVYYNGDARPSALGVAKTLGIDEANVTENTEGYTSDFDVVLVLGSDYQE